MEKEKVTIAIPQWQGGGQDLRTYRGAYALADNYMGGAEVIFANISDKDLSPLKNDILGYDDILESVRTVKCILREQNPKRLFTIGGGCDADVPCMTYLNGKYGGDMAVVYLDAHGDLNLPETSDSKLYYGMSLRAAAGEGDAEIIAELGSTVLPKQLIMGANRNLDAEEIRFKKDKNVADFALTTLENDPTAIARHIKEQGYSKAYIHIDLDCLDPQKFALKPVPEPNGLKADTLVKIIYEIRKVCEVVGFAILEYSGGSEDKQNELLRQLAEYGKEI